MRARCGEDDDGETERLYSILQCLFALHRMESDERHDMFKGTVHTNTEGNG